ncbi:MAG: amidohydrolase family protein [Verrucomicrobia bacterium]|nr:amidohydrolase family protein [Verrucomicrobiota bacterium]
MNRRRFLQSGALALAAGTTGCVHHDGPGQDILDTHTHFYDPVRPQGVPWPNPGDAVLYRTVMPAEFQSLAAPLGVTGTVVIEASAWPEDNDWLLQLADRDPFLRGVVGNLVPGQPRFRSDLKRLSRQPRFCGIRIGAQSLQAALERGPARTDLHQLADLDGSLDLLIPPERLPDAAQLGRLIPDLRIIVDHCGNVPVGSPPPGEWTGGLAACHYAPNVFMKVSGLVEGTGRRGGQAPTDPEFYLPVLNALWGPFGEDRLIFGSNWPVCLHFASYSTVLEIVRAYFNSKGATAAGKYFNRNARRAYRTRPG